MKVRELHSWNVTPKEAVAIQRDLAGRIVMQYDGTPVSVVAGVDLSYDRASDMLFAAVIVLDAETLDTIEVHSAVRKSTFPYVPGLLSFREIPALLECFKIVENIPDAVLCDGQGYAHPRRMGLATHLGLLLEIPTIGCAKSRLTGEAQEPGQKRGSSVPLHDDGEQIGAVVRTRDRVKPLYVSVGHMIDLDTAVEVTLGCCAGYRLPEPTRRAHLEVNRIRKDYLSSQ